MRLVTSDQWTCQHFSLANALDDRPSDLPHLLRRIADELDRLQVRPMELLDVTIAGEMTGDGPWWSATVYWSPDEGSAEASAAGRRLRSVGR